MNTMLTPLGSMWAEFDARQLVPERPMRAQWTEHPCDLVTYHAPQPVMTEFHHQKPVFLQNRLYGKIIYGPSLWVCSNCHDAIHAWLYFRLGEWRKPTYIGRAAKAEAEKTFDWYMWETEAA